MLELVVNRCFQVSTTTPAYGNDERDNAREDIRTSASSLPTDRAAPIVSGTAQWISILKGTGSREKRNEPNADGFSGYPGVFEDTHQVTNKVSHSGRTLDITGVT